MHRGFTRAYRKEIDSQIWLMPPIYHRVWYTLRLKARYVSSVFPTPKKFGIHLNPGQIITSLDQISQWVAWTEWGCEKKPNKKIIKTVLVWLQCHDMIILESNGKGTFIFITNWDTYNGVKGKEVTIDGLRSGSPRETVKECINKEQERKTKRYKKEIFPKPEWIKNEEWADLLESRKAKKLQNTKAALTPFANQLKLAKEKGYSVRQCLDEFIPSRWTRFKAEWMDNISAGTNTDKDSSPEEDRRVDKMIEADRLWREKRDRANKTNAY